MPTIHSLLQVLAGLDPDVLEYVCGVVMDDDQLIPEEDLIEAVGPLLTSADFVADDEAGEALAKVLWEKINLSGSAGERKAEVQLLKSAVLMGGDEKKAELMLNQGDGLGSMHTDPGLQRHRRAAAGGAGSYGTNDEDTGPDVHSKAAAAKARMDAKAEVARIKAAEEQTREHLKMEAELATRRREAARARIDGKSSGASSVIESSA